MSFFQYLPKGSAKKIPPRRAPKTINAMVEEVVRSTPLFMSAKSSFAPRPAKQSKSKTVENKPVVNAEEDKIDVETCDILYIDEQIKRKLSSKIGTLNALQSDLSALLWIFNNSSDPIDKITAAKRTESLRKVIKDVEGGFEYGLYLIKTDGMIEEYKKIISGTSVNSFIRDLRTSDSAPKIHRKNQIILEFLRIARQHVNLENFKQKRRNTPTCDVCHGTNLKESDDSSIFICICGNQIEILDDAPTFKDAERVNMASRYTYTCRGHFIESMNKFEGKQNIEIGIEVLEILQREMKCHSLTPKIFTKDHLYMFMQENKLSDFYADINLIFFLLTQNNAPDITKYRIELLEMFDQIEEAYAEVKDDDRLNSLNVNWKLYKLLQLLDYNCKKDDFFCLKTPIKQGEHEEKWHDMIEYLQSKYPDATTSYGKKRWRHTRTL